MPLSDAALRAAKPREKPYRLTDERGLYLEIRPTGARWWRIRYRFAGKAQLLSAGTYPEVTLKEARQRRDEIRRQARDGIDPSAARKALRHQAAGADTFAVLAEEWFLKFQPGWAPSNAVKVRRHLEELLPWLGARPVKALEPPELLAVARRIESRGALETAHRVLQTAGRIFRYGVATGRALRDPTADLRGALPPHRGGHFAAITDPAEVGQLLRALEGFSGTFIVKCALRLLPRLFVRSQELRLMTWAELDLDAGNWRIPADRMKMRKPHFVPLAPQCVALLRELHPLTGAGPLVFPGLRSRTRPISDVTLLAGLRRLGYGKEQMTVHGFRTLASTILHEQGFHPDVIERQLAHAERNAVKAAYNRAEYLQERRRMMNAWNDYLDGLTAGATVVPLHRGRARG